MSDRDLASTLAAWVGVAAGRLAVRVEGVAEERLPEVFLAAGLQLDAELAPGVRGAVRVEDPPRLGGSPSEEGAPARSPRENSTSS